MGKVIVLFWLTATAPVTKDGNIAIVVPFGLVVADHNDVEGHPGNAVAFGAAVAASKSTNDKSS